MMKRRAPRPKRDGRVTGTPRARLKRKPLTQSMGSPMDKAPRAVARKTTLGGESAAKAASSGAGSARNKALETKLKELMKKKYASDRAGKARSTGTPKMTKKPATTGRMTRKPTAVGTPAKPKTATQQARKVTRRRLPTGMDIPKTATRRTRTRTSPTTRRAAASNRTLMRRALAPKRRG